jgi:3',5'-cyclic AMP phosphodiesterase CpdA
MHDPAMFVLAQLSDLHLSSTPPFADLMSKRGLGFINWQRKRKYVHRPDVLEAIIRDLKSLAVDHTAVTGDLINFSTQAEYRRARAWLETLGPPSAVTVIPGNHDIYVPAATGWPAEFWGDYMRGDGATEAGSFPFVRRRGAVALIALSSALPTAPFLATGFLGEQQLARFAVMLDETRGLFRVVLIHHPPTIAGRLHLRRLIDATEFRRVLARKGAELVIHGHDHCHSLVWLDGPQRPIPAAGAPSASANAAHGSEDAAGYNLFQIAEVNGGFSCEMIMRQRTADGSVREFERQTLF